MPARKKHDIPFPEQNARHIINEFKKVFQLTEKEYDKVYELYLDQEKSLIPKFGNGFNSGMPPQGRMGRLGGGFGDFGGNHLH